LYIDWTPHVFVSYRIIQEWYQYYTYIPNIVINTVTYLPTYLETNIGSTRIDKSQLLVKIKKTNKNKKDKPQWKES